MGLQFLLPAVTKTIYSPDATKDSSGDEIDPMWNLDESYDSSSELWELRGGPLKRTYRTSMSTPQKLTPQKNGSKQISSRAESPVFLPSNYGSRSFALNQESCEKPLWDPQAESKQQTKRDIIRSNSKDPRSQFQRRGPGKNLATPEKLPSLNDAVHPELHNSQKTPERITFQYAEGNGHKNGCHSNKSQSSSGVANTHYMELVKKGTSNISQRRTRALTQIMIDHESMLEFSESEARPSTSDIESVLGGCPSVPSTSKEIDVNQIADEDEEEALIEAEIEAMMEIQEMEDVSVKEDILVEIHEWQDL